MQTNPSLSVLNALSPLDGRYASRCEGLRPLLSEAGFMAHRVEVEIAWLIGLSEAGLQELPAFTPAARKILNTLVSEFSEADADRIKQIERVTNHDVKAVEYWLKEKVAGYPELEKAGRVADFIELGELMCRDALVREESCGGHFREEHQDNGEAKRDDENFCHVAAWEWNGTAKTAQTRHIEDLKFENVKLATRSYK